MTTISSSTSTFPVVIIGAGLAGISAALHLAERGIPPLLLDSDQLWPGGRIAGGEPDIFEHQGKRWSFPSDHGVHALWGNYDNLRALLARFAPLELIESEGEEWINRWGRKVSVVEAGTAVRSGWLPAPFHYLQLLFRPRFWRTITPLDFLSLPGFLFSILWTVGMDPIAEGEALDGLLMEEYFRGWTPNLRATFTGVGVNLMAAPAESISMMGFIAALRFYTLLRRDSWAMQYFPGNLHTCVVAPLLKALEERGGQIRKGVTAQRLERAGNGWRIVVDDMNIPGSRAIYAEQVLLAVQPPAAQRLLSSSPETAEISARLKFPGAVRNLTVRLWFDAQPRQGAPSGMFTGDFLPDNFFWLHRLQPEFKDWAATGGSAIEVHLYAKDDVQEQPEKVLIVTVVNEVLRAFPELKGHFIYGALRRNSRNHTEFRVPTADSLHIETPWPNLYACGDWIGYPSPAFWMERATVTGIAAANQVLKAQGCEPFEPIAPRKAEGLARGLGWLSRGIRLTIGRAMIGAGRQIRGKSRG
jgi:carotenoid phi-ring synthase / carotenoid chi-ring synthase